MSISTFIRKVSVERLEAFFIARSVKIDDEIWSGAVTARVSSITSTIHGRSETDQALLLDDIERIREMADEEGRVALEQLGISSSLEVLSEWDLAAEIFCQDQEGFKRAEQVRFTDRYRRGRTWSGWTVKGKPAIGSDEEALAAFETSLREELGSERKIQIDPFRRERKDVEGQTHTIHQFTVYREGSLQAGLEFLDSGLERRLRRPAIEAAVTYEPESGTLEVVARDREARDDLAQIFGRTMLEGAEVKDALQLRRYDLSVLLTRFAFPTDPEDGIEEVFLQSLRLMPSGTSEERVTIERLAKPDGTLWDMAENRFGPRSPLNGDWIITKAAIVVRFRASKRSRKKSVPFTITMPHGCSLKERTAREITIAEKYFEKWGLLKKDDIDVVT